MSNKEEKKCCSDATAWKVSVKALAPPPAVPWEYVALGTMLGGLMLGCITGMT